MTTLMDEHAERLEKKLDEILIILHGGSNGDMGVVQKVTILWRLVLTWPLCTGSAIGGALLTLVLQRIFK